MLVQNMKCPFGCEKATFTESVKSTKETSDNLLLENQNNKKVKVYTCNCCNKTFEIPSLQESTNNILFS